MQTNPPLMQQQSTILLTLGCQNANPRDSGYTDAQYRFRAWLVMGNICLAALLPPAAMLLRPNGQSPRSPAGNQG